MGVTKRLVKLRGGSIGVESTGGVGSTFWIELSLTSAPMQVFRDSGGEAPALNLVRDGRPPRVQVSLGKAGTQGFDDGAVLRV